VPLHVASHQWNPHFESRNISILDEDSSHVWGFNKSDQVVSQRLGILPHSWIFRLRTKSYRFWNTTFQHYWLFIGWLPPWLWAPLIIQFTVQHWPT
jgi:hypothetical protein